MKAKVQVVVIDREVAMQRGRILRQLRRSAGATLEDVTRRSGVSMRRLSSAECGEGPLTPSEWRVVARALRRMISNRITEGLRALESLSA